MSKHSSQGWLNRERAARHKRETDKAERERNQQFAAQVLSQVKRTVEEANAGIHLPGLCDTSEVYDGGRDTRTFNGRRTQHLSRLMNLYMTPEMYVALQEYAEITDQSCASVVREVLQSFLFGE